MGTKKRGRKAAPAPPPPSEPPAAEQFDITKLSFAAIQHEYARRARQLRFLQAKRQELDLALLDVKKQIAEFGKLAGGPMGEAPVAAGPAAPRTRWTPSYELVRRFPAARHKEAVYSAGSLGAMVIALTKPGDIIDSKSVAAMLAANGAHDMKANSISGMLGRMRNEGVLELLGKGRYERI